MHFDSIIYSFLPIRKDGERTSSSRQSTASGRQTDSPASVSLRRVSIRRRTHCTDSIITRTIVMIIRAALTIVNSNYAFGMSRKIRGQEDSCTMMACTSSGYRMTFIITATHLTEFIFREWNSKEYCLLCNWNLNGEHNYKCFMNVT